MKYQVNLIPLKPYFFGGDTTFGTKGDKENSSYLIHSRKFPQQSAILGMLKKEIMIQSGVLTKKVKGEWVDNKYKQQAATLVGSQKFDIFSNKPQDFGTIKNISPIFLIQNGKRYIKKVDIASYPYKNQKLENYNAKIDIYDNYISLDSNDTKSSNDIFEIVEQIGNSKLDEEDSLFKKSSYILKDGFKFAFYLECEYELKNSIVYLGADKSVFKLELIKDDGNLDYEDNNGYLTLLSDAYVTVPLKDNCEFAITSEISYRQLINSFDNNQRRFEKSKKIYLYEKGSVIINPSDKLLDNLNNKNLQQIGYNKYTMKG